MIAPRLTNLKKFLEGKNILKSQKARHKNVLWMQDMHDNSTAAKDPKTCEAPLYSNSAMKTA